LLSNFWRKYTLTVQEAAKYFRIGDKKLKKLIDEHPDADFITHLSYDDAEKEMRKACNH